MMSSKFRLVGMVFLSFFMWSNVGHAASLNENTARNYIVSLSKRLDVILDHSKTPSLNERKAHLRHLFQENFAIPQIAQFIVNRHWREMSPKEKEDYLKAFKTFVLYKYADQVVTIPLTGHYRVANAQAVGNGKHFIVNTIIDTGNSQSVTLGWRVAMLNGRPQIIDILVEGLSMLQTEQDSFGSIIDRDGVQGLIRLLKDKNKELIAKK